MTTSERDHPTDNLVRAFIAPEAIEFRSTDGGGRKMFGHFAVFNRWTEIDSWYEGRFLERIAPTAFDRAFREQRDRIRVLYDHGHDPSVGNKPLGVAETLRADGVGAFYEVDLFDAGYVNDLLPALRANQLGASFRFRVVGQSWNDPTQRSDHNPERLPERTITDVDLYEFGPVTFPAYADATAGVRSMTDTFADRLLHDPTFVARFTERVGEKVAARVLSSLPSDGRGQDPAPTVPADGGSTEAPTTFGLSAEDVRAMAMTIDKSAPGGNS